MFNRAFSNYSCNQYFFKLTTIAAFVNGTHPHKLCVIGFQKNGSVSQYLQALKSACDQGIK